MLIFYYYALYFSQICFLFFNLHFKGLIMSKIMIYRLTHFNISIN